MLSASILAMPPEVVPEFPLHGPYSHEQLAALAAALGTVLDASPRLDWHPAASDVLASGRSATLLRVEGSLGGAPVVAVLRQQEVTDSGAWCETRVGARLDTAPVRVELIRGTSSGPKLPTGIAEFDGEYCLQGHPRELVQALLDAPRLAWVKSHHLAGLDISATEVTLRVDGWVVDPSACTALLRFAVELGQRIAVVARAAAEARANAAGHGDVARAARELGVEWQREAAAYDAAQRRTGCLIASVVAAVVALLAVAVGATLYFAR